MRTYYPALLILVFIFCAACSKDKDASNNNEETSADLISNLSKSPDILLGSWNLNKNTSTESSGKTSADCQATNIHFLSDNTFYLKYGVKRIKGKYEIIDSTTVNLFNGTQIIGNVSKIEIDENNISLTIEITDECSDDYTGEKYFRIHQFVWEAMNSYYLWQEEVPSLNDENKPESAKYKEIIAPYPEPEAFFESLKHQEDKYSVIRSNYVDLENSIKGIDASNGIEFILSRYGSGENILGVVTYILEESDASNKNIKRGDIFIGVDNKDLTSDNYKELLFGENLNYTLNMADLNNNVLSPNGKNIALTKIENFQSNPIQINKIIQTNGMKVGYLMYNQFAQGFDDDLNEAFANFKLERIDELIIDLRYNGGGLTRSALNLAGMITGQFNGEIFAKYLWNQKLMNVFNSDPTKYASYLGENFTQQLADGSAINSLNLNKVYVITSNRSASSSELLINGLAPYINVIQVGDNTYGKNVGGLAALYDYIDNNGTKNPDHTYAVYCMSFYSANSQDFYEYADGLVPQADFKLKEDLTNLGVLGENSEPLLSLALSHINNNTARYQIKAPIFPLENMVDDPQFIKDQLFTTDKKLPLLQLN
ncbi:MAG: S41 family peptidase [Flavobacteriaceae bacterium]